MEELINRVSERTELADFLLDVVAQLKIGDIKEFDKTVNTEDKLEALGETSRGAVVSDCYRRGQAGKYDNNKNNNYIYYLPPHYYHHHYHTTTTTPPPLPPPPPTEEL